MNQQQKCFKYENETILKTHTHLDLAWAKGVRAFCLSGVCYRYWACWQGGAFIPHCYQSVIWVSTFCSLTQHTGFRWEILFWEMESCTWKPLWIFRVTKGDETGSHSVFKLVQVWAGALTTTGSYNCCCVDLRSTVWTNMAAVVVTHSFKPQQLFGWNFMETHNSKFLLVISEIYNISTFPSAPKKSSDSSQNVQELLTANSVHSPSAKNVT